MVINPFENHKTKADALREMLFPPRTPTYETFVLLPLMSFSIYCTFKNHKTSLRLRNYISSVSYTNLLGICAITIIVNWYYEPPSTIEV